MLTRHFKTFRTQFHGITCLHYVLVCNNYIYKPKMVPSRLLTSICFFWKLTGMVCYNNASLMNMDNDAKYYLQPNIFNFFERLDNLSHCNYNPCLSTRILLIYLFGYPMPNFGSSSRDGLTRPTDGHREPLNEVGSIVPDERLAGCEPGIFGFEHKALPHFETNVGQISC